MIISKGTHAPHTRTGCTTHNQPTHAPHKSTQDLPEDAPVIILLPGLTGGSTDTYVQHAVQQARAVGVRAAVSGRAVGLFGRRLRGLERQMQVLMVDCRNRP